MILCDLKQIPESCNEFGGKLIRKGEQDSLTGLALNLDRKQSLGEFGGLHNPSTPTLRNPAMKTFILCLLSFTLAAEDVKPKPQPPEVLNALAVYEKGLIEARKKYEAEEGRLRAEACRKLEDAKKSYARKEDLEGGMLCQAKVKELNDGEVMRAVEENYGKGKVLVNSAVKEVWIEASSDGVSVGTLKKGQTLVVQYLEGEWSLTQKAKKVSPDSPTIGPALRTALFNKNNVTFPVSTIQGGTALKPFEIFIQEDGDYVLRIVDNAGREDNPGKARYRYILK
jgi:hypothetical protein